MSESDEVRSDEVHYRSASHALLMAAEVAGPIVGPTLAVVAKHKLDSRPPKEVPTKVELPSGVKLD